MLSILLSATVFMSGEFAPYTASFVKDSQGLIRPEDVVGSIVFKEQEYSEKGHGVIGLCYPSVPFITDGFAIEIDPDYWREASEEDRWQLMYHELGHCLCDLDHTEYPAGQGFISFLEGHGVKTDRKMFLPGGCEKTIMHPYDISAACVKRYKEQYIKDIFSRCQPVLPTQFYIDKTR